MNATETTQTYQQKPFPAKVESIGWSLFLVGLLIAIVSFFVDPIRTHFNFIMLFMFLASIGIGALFLVAIEYISGAVWSTPVRRVSELVAGIIPYLPLFALVAAVPVMTGNAKVYHWLHAHGDKILELKSPFLNMPFFLVRLGMILGLWFLFYKAFVGSSIQQDISKDQAITRRNIKLSALFLPIFGLSISVLSIDFLMSLEPHWFSTIFGVNFFGGTIVASMAVITIALILLNENGYLHPGINNHHYYSLGFGMFAGNVFWAYTAFSQGMLQWYANLPEETPWYIHRWEGSWKVITIALIFVHFVIPFLLLIQRKSKTGSNRMLFISVWFIFAHMFDIYWIAMPVFSPGHATLSFTEPGFMMMAVGFIMVAFALKAKKVNLIPVGDPKLQRGLAFRLPFVK